MNLDEIKNIYFIGIGGIGMSALAHYFHARDKNIAGYDRVQTSITDKLSALGIALHYQEAVSQIPKAFLEKKETLVVYTAAIPDMHKELNYFKQHNFKICKRSELLGLVTRNSFCMAVAGTHGKTTTTSILGHILKQSGVSVTVFTGGISENYQSNLIMSGTEVSVVEADEFDRSFLQLSPDSACITATDADHLDIYGKKEAVQQSFQDFVQKIKSGGKLFVKKGLDFKGLTYGIEESADYVAIDVRVEKGVYKYDVKTPDGILRDIELKLPGRHNICNATAALAMAHDYGVSLEKIAAALRTFKGVKRRFSTHYIEKTRQLLVDDYAHHPQEIKAVTDTLGEMYPQKKTLGIFQPHLYSRTRDFADDFAKSLSRFDELLLLEIYPARELPIEGITATWLLDKVKDIPKKRSSKERLMHHIKKSKAEIVVVLGAGDIGNLVPQIIKELSDEG